MFSQCLALLEKHCSIVAVSYTLEKKIGLSSCIREHKNQLKKECVLVSEGSHVLYEGSFLLF